MSFSIRYSQRRLHYLRGISFVAALALVAGCNKQAAAPAGPPAGMAMPVAVVEATSTRVPTLSEAVGQTEGSREVEVRARVSGIVQKRLYREGEPVRAGAVLFQIDRAPFEVILDQARAAREQERARGEQTQRDVGRLKQLLAVRAVSQKEYDDALSAVKLAEAGLLAAEARVREAQLNLSYATVTAPISGVTGRALRSEGSLVTAGNDSALLTTISQTDPIWVRFSFSEAEFARLRQGAKKAQVKLLLADGKIHPTPGRLNFAASTIDTRLGTVQLRAEFPNPGLMLLPGQFVRAQVTTGEQEAFLIPQAAVVQNDQGRFLWTIGADGKAALKPVEAASWSGQEWVIRSGLVAGDKVIVDNLLKLRPGAPVQPQQKGAGPAPASPAPRTDAK